jgi:hypothetical protein
MPAEEEVFAVVRGNFHLYLNYQIMIIFFVAIALKSIF